MGERFVVVPVDGGAGVAADEEQSDAAIDDPAPVSAARGEQEAAEEPQDQDGVLPILEYNREPNKYGMTAEPDPPARTHGSLLTLADSGKRKKAFSTSPLGDFNL